MLNILEIIEFVFNGIDLFRGFSILYGSVLFRYVVMYLFLIRFLFVRRLIGLRKICELWGMLEIKSESVYFERGGNRIFDCVWVREICFWLLCWILGVEIEVMVVLLWKDIYLWVRFIIVLFCFRKFWFKMIVWGKFFKIWKVWGIFKLLIFILRFVWLRIVCDVL